MVASSHGMKRPLCQIFSVGLSMAVLYRGAGFDPGPTIFHPPISLPVYCRGSTEYVLSQYGTLPMGSPLTVISTRRFCSRPAALLFDTSG